MEILSISIRIAEDNIILPGELTTDPNMKALIIFAHGSGSSRLSPRNQSVAQALNHAGLGTLLFDLLTEEESQDRDNVFNIDLLSRRLLAATDWAVNYLKNKKVEIGYFGASTGAAAALQAAAVTKNKIFAIVSRGGRPDLAHDYLEKVKAPTLLIVGEMDFGVVPLNNYAVNIMSNARIIFIPEATHLFEEPGALEAVAWKASDWFNTHLGTQGGRLQPSAAV